MALLELRTAIHTTFRTTVYFPFTNILFIVHPFRTWVPCTVFQSVGHHCNMWVPKNVTNRKHVSQGPNCMHIVCNDAPLSHCFGTLKHLQWSGILPLSPTTAKKVCKKRQIAWTNWAWDHNAGSFSIPIRFCATAVGTSGGGALGILIVTSPAHFIEGF